MTGNVDDCYRSGEYVCDLSQKLKAQRFGDASFCDIVLVAEGVEFAAHRCVLAAGSEYFQVMFNIDMAERTQSRIHLGGVTADALARLLEFIYTGSLCITKESVVNLIFLSSMLMMPLDVTHACWEHLQKTLDVENCMERKMLADSVSDSEHVSNNITAYVVENIAHLDANAVANCPVGFVRDLLSRDDLPVANELEVFLVFLKWCARDLTEKEKFADTLLDVVRFAFLSLDRDALLNILGSYGITTNKSSVICDSILERAETRSGLREPRLSYRNEPVVAVVGGQGEGAVLRKVSTYLPSCRSWHELSDMNHSRKSFGLVAINSDLFVVGGTMEQAFDRPVPFIERYDTRKDAWEEICVTSTNALERDGAGVVGFRGNVILAGGLLIASGAIVSSVIELDPFNGNWKRLASLNVAREGHVVVANDTGIYVVGGKNPQSEILDSLERYDVDSETWTVLKSMNTKRCHACAVWFDGKLYVFGGYDGTRVLKSVEVYEPEYDRWQPLTDMFTSRMKFGVSVFHDSAYVIGGMKGSRGPMVSDVEVYSFRDSTWSSVSSMDEVKMEMNCATITVPFKFLK